MTKKPIIGITLDYQDEGSFSPRPYYAVRQSYFDAVKAAGGLAIGVPYQPDHVNDYAQQIDGLIVPGGDFGLDPAWYVDGDKPGFDDSPRLDFDIAIIKAAISKGVPILGICAGMQILAGMFGAKLTSDIAKYSDSKKNHLDEIIAEEYAHIVTVESGSVFERIVGAEEIEVNSRHKEGVVEVSDEVIVSGKSEDGIIEAIEIAGNDFVIGVQWHPEFFIEEGNPNFELFKALVKTAS